MLKTPVPNAKVLKELNTQLKKLQDELADAVKVAAMDDYLDINVTANQARYERSRSSKGEEVREGKFLIELAITATKATVFIPTSIASGKKPTGFVYHIEGTSQGFISSASVKWRGAGVTEVTLGTLFYSKIPLGKTATFILQATIRGSAGKAYKIVINRIHFKLNLTDVRYKQYTKELMSDSVTLS